MSIAELRNTNGSVGQTASKEARGGYSSSVEAALGHFGADAVTAVELAAQILRDHTHYGSDHGGEAARKLDALTSANPDAERRPARDWVAQIAALFQPEAVITGRCVLVGIRCTRSKVA